MGNYIYGQKPSPNNEYRCSHCGHLNKQSQKVLYDFAESNIPELVEAVNVKKKIVLHLTKYVVSHVQHDIESGNVRVGYPSNVACDPDNMIYGEENLNLIIDGKPNGYKLNSIEYLDGDGTFNMYAVLDSTIEVGCKAHGYDTGYVIVPYEGEKKFISITSRVVG